jgi:hypothetical protein
MKQRSWPKQKCLTTLLHDRKAFWSSIREWVGLWFSEKKEPGCDTVDRDSEPSWSCCWRSWEVTGEHDIFSTFNANYATPPCLHCRTSSCPGWVCWLSVIVNRRRIVNIGRLTKVLTSNLGYPTVWATNLYKIADSFFDPAERFRLETSDSNCWNQHLTAKNIRKKMNEQKHAVRSDFFRRGLSPKKREES